MNKNNFFWPWPPYTLKWQYMQVSPCKSLNKYQKIYSAKKIFRFLHCICISVDPERKKVKSEQNVNSMWLGSKFQLILIKNLGCYFCHFLALISNWKVGFPYTFKMWFLKIFHPLLLPHITNFFQVHPP